MAELATSDIAIGTHIDAATLAISRDHGGFVSKSMQKEPPTLTTSSVLRQSRYWTTSTQTITSSKAIIQKLTEGDKQTMDSFTAADAEYRLPISLSLAPTSSCNLSSYPVIATLPSSLIHTAMNQKPDLPIRHSSSETILPRADGKILMPFSSLGVQKNRFTTEDLTPFSLRNVRHPLFRSPFRSSLYHLCPPYTSAHGRMTRSQDIFHASAEPSTSEETEDGPPNDLNLRTPSRVKYKDLGYRFSLNCLSCSMDDTLPDACNNSIESFSFPSADMEIHDKEPAFDLYNAGADVGVRDSMGNFAMRDDSTSTKSDVSYNGYQHSKQKEKTCIEFTAPMARSAAEDTTPYEDVEPKIGDAFFPLKRHGIHETIVSKNDVHQEIRVPVETSYAMVLERPIHEVVRRRDDCENSLDSPVISAFVFSLRRGTDPSRRSMAPDSLRSTAHHQENHYCRSPHHKSMEPRRRRSPTLQLPTETDETDLQIHAKSLSTRGSSILLRSAENQECFTRDRSNRPDHLRASLISSLENLRANDALKPVTHSVDGLSSSCQSKWLTKSTVLKSSKT
ncbi:hypothetical protein KP509_31G005600 [Ceratopteris richardii]|uniref:Uncharacterized protein n=1 Tax=Ceratopteris richardii TaxID=49495 RepID=A0A8T2QX10_CERRI|nr:hypothetical protein KP509_31G005600 [Ceratopteris richardii]